MMRNVLSKIKTAVIFLLAVALCLGVYTYVIGRPLSYSMGNHSETIAKLEAELKAAQSEIDSLQSALAASEEALESIKAECEQLKADLQSATADRAQLKADLQHAREELEILEKSLGESLKDLEESGQAAQAIIDQLKQELEIVKQQLSAPEDKIRIYIDQGHNPSPYYNSGSKGNGLNEEDVTFLVGKLLADLLRNDNRFEVQLSRPNKDVVLGTDNKSSILARVEGAAAFEADYLISLHTNAFTSESANGIEVYAAKEGSESYVFGEYLLDGLLESTKLRNRGMKIDPELSILRLSAMPAVLVEMGFISNSGDAAMFAEHPELFAQGLYNGILEYFGFQ